MTAFSDLTAGLVSKLSEVPPLAAGRIYRGQAWPMPEGTDSMIWVRPIQTASERETLSGAPLEWQTSFEVEIRFRYTPDTQAPDESVDDLIGLVFQRLAAFTATGVMDVIPGTSLEWDYSESDLNIAGATVRLDIIHRTGSSILSAL